MSTPTRRGLLSAAAAAASAVVLSGAPAGAAERRRTFGPRTPRRSPVPAPRTPSTPAAPAPSPLPVPTGDAFTLHLLKRTTYGLTPALLEQVRALGTQAWLDRQLAPQTIDDTPCEAVVARFTKYWQDPPQHWTEDRFGWGAMYDTISATIARATFSERQLLEVMVEFWSNHLNTTAPSSDVWAAKGWDDRTVIRPHALGRFSDMLVASAASPAMLEYLDGAESQGSAPNENYGRELLELHTVGRDSGYTQADVVACARALTGRTIWTPWNGGTTASYGTFRYRPDWHHVGPLAVLGWSHPNASPGEGMTVGDSLLRHLAAHPATARRIARKLCVRFVSDDPPAALVDRLATVYLASGTAIIPVLRGLFASPEFAASVGQKQRRPYEDLVATLRTLGVTAATSGTKAFRDLHWNLEQIGQSPFGWHPPDGYPDVAAAWTGTGTLLGRWNLHVGIAGGWWKEGLTYAPDLYGRLLPGAVPVSRADLVTRTAARLMPDIALPAAHVDALVTFLGGAGAVKDSDRTYMYPSLVALLLDSPHWSVR